MIKTKLRVYQQKVVNVLKAMETKYGNFSTIMELPTGAGKTLTAIDYIVSQALENQCKVLWLTHRDFLLKQAQEELNKETGKKYKNKSIIVSGANDDIDDIDDSKDVIFGSIFSMTAESISNKDGVSAFGNWLAKSQEGEKRLYIIIDEAHHVGSNTYDSLLEALLLPNNAGEIIVKNYALVGLTATPFREDATELRLMKWFKMGYVEKYPFDYADKKDTAEESDYLTCKPELYREIGSNIGTNVVVKAGKVIGSDRHNFGNTISIIELQELIDAKVLIAPDFFRVDDYDLEAMKDFENNEEELAKSVVENINNSIDLGKTIIFAPNSKVATKIKDLLGENKCVAVTADTSKKVQLKMEKRKKDNIFDAYGVDYIVTIDVLSEGFDVKNLNTVILIGGIVSRARLRQRIGRVVRKAENKDKKARVIWYYIAKDKAEASKKIDTYEKNGLGYIRNEQVDMQSLESVDNDRTRKTYYLTAPKYSQPVGYALQYNLNSYSVYTEFLNILALFQTNSNRLKDLVGFYRVQGGVIYLNNLLKKGFEHLFRRVRCQWLILKDAGIRVSNTDDFVAELHIGKQEYIDDVKKICFFLCKPKKSSIFNIEDDDIELFIDEILRRSGNEPEFVDIHSLVLAFAKAIVNSGVANITKDPYKILDLALESDISICIDEKDEETDIDEDTDTDEVVVKDNNISDDIIEGTPKEIFEKICEDNELPEDVVKGLVIQGIIASKNEIEKQIGEEREALLNDEKVSSISEVSQTALLRYAIRKERRREFNILKSSQSKYKEHTKELRVDSYINYELEDLASMIKKYRMNWSNKPVKYKDNGTMREFAWDDLVLSGGTWNIQNGSYNTTLRLPRRLAVSSTMAICQSILINTHHLVVSKNDAKEYENAIDTLVNSIGVTIVGQYDDLARDIVCRLGYEMENSPNRPYFRSLIEFFRDKGIPRFLAYLMYDIVYEAVWREVDFIRDGVVSSYCQNEHVLTNIKDTILQGYKLPADFFDRYNLQPVADAIFDYRPYTKVLSSYLGIKPDLLCRMMNLIAKQAPDCDHFITGCGGSAAGLINRFNPINDNITTETYNEYGYLLTNFYLVLQDDIQYKALMQKIARLIDLICDSSSTARNIIEKEFTNPIYDYFRQNNWVNPNTKEEYKSFERVFNISGSKASLDAIGIDGRPVKPEAQQQDIELIKSFLNRYPLIMDYYNNKYANSPNTTLLDEAIKDIQLRENVLYGVRKVFRVFYLWCQGASDADIQAVNISNVDLALIVYVMYSFNLRKRFYDCFIDSFVKFAASYRQNLEMGHERVKDWDIRKPAIRDVNIILGDKSPYNKATAITYCDIPYAETDASLYVDEHFDFEKFVKNLDNFEGKYIVSSRYNICTSLEFKMMYYIWKLFTDKEKEAIIGESHEKLITNIVNSIKTDEIFFTSEERRKILKGLTSNNKESYWKVLVGRVKEYSNHLVLRAFAGNKIFISSKEDVKKVLGETHFERKITNIYNFYKSFADMTENKPKYIVIPYTNTEEVQNNTNKRGLKKVRNNYRLRDYDVDIMFKNTIFSNIPVEVMVTNVEMLNKVSEESLLLETYKISDGVFALPTVRADASSSSYLAEPIYLVLTYDRYMEYMKENLMHDEDDDVREALDIFRGYLATRDDL